jgi:pyrophosphatase PpaX
LKYDVILFDLDGTLLDTNELIIQSFLHVFDYDPSLKRERIISHFGMPLEKQLVDYAGRPEGSSGADLVQKYRAFNNAKHDEMVRAFPGVVETLRALRERGVRVGVVTSKIRFTTERGLVHVGIKPYVESVVTIEDVEHPKPHAESIHKALRELSVGPEARVLMVGDSGFDLGCAQNAGVDSCWVGWGLKPREQMLAMNPTHVIEAMEDLLRLA